MTKAITPENVPFAVDHSYAQWETFEYAASWVLAAAYIAAVVAAMIFTGITAPIYLPVTTVAAMGAFQPVAGWFTTIRAWAAENGEKAQVEADVQQELGGITDDTPPKKCPLKARMFVWGIKVAALSEQAHERPEYDLEKLGLYEQAVRAKVMAVFYMAIYDEVIPTEADFPIEFVTDKPPLRIQALQQGIRSICTGDSGEDEPYLRIRADSLSFNLVKDMSQVELYDRAFPSRQSSLKR